MTAQSSHEAILRAARRQFAEYGFNRATVRDIAREAGVSAALVIKVFGSKAGLFTEAGRTSVPLLDLDIPRSLMGRALVRRIASRRDEGAEEPWATIVASIREGPDPDAARTEAAETWRSTMAELIGDSTPDRTHASIVVCLLIGLAEGVRVVGLFDESECAGDDLVDLWAPIVQRQIDEC